MPDPPLVVSGASGRALLMHPELGNQVVRTSLAIKTRLDQAGLAPRVLLPR
ncbi:hypothetical protein PUR58_01380 [Streptomyces sp. JV186]|uniref:hypothetical protein n=1 Tax=Streptomyces sp. JV186 TaxID=858639 RepID=UPI002E768467|nr:hypothetical protein [Streptomyces sp. JV186]MEE1721651.1 hypothetical protein [Streptomyces sp. JV186]